MTDSNGNRFRYLAKGLLKQLIGKTSDNSLHDSIRRLRDAAPGLNISGRDNSGPQILMIAMRGDNYAGMIEAYMAASLNLRGARCRVLLCDGVLPACSAYRSEHGYTPRCEWCQPNAEGIYGGMGLDCIHISDYITDEDIAIAKSEADAVRDSFLMPHNFRGIDIGGTAKSALYAFLLTASPEPTPENVDMFARMVDASARMALMAQKLIDETKPDLIISSHGIYVNWGPLLAVANQKQIPGYVWGRGYKTDTLLVTKDYNWSEALLAEDDSQWLDQPMTEAADRHLDDYLRSRIKGTEDFIKYNPNPMSDQGLVRTELGLDPDKPVYSLFANIAWDGAAVGRDVIFNDMNDWLLRTVEWFSTQPDRQLVIRVHPAETRLDVKTKDGVEDILAKHYPVLPDNVRVVGSTSSVDSYVLGAMSAATILFTGKLGIEFSIRGIPAVVAGRAFYRGKGFTFDPDTEEEYHEILSNASLEVTEQMTERARAYGNYFFVRKYVSYPLVNTVDPGEVRIDSLNELLPGQNEDLDWFCDRILNGEQVTLPVLQEQRSS